MTNDPANRVGVSRKVDEGPKGPQRILKSPLARQEIRENRSAHLETVAAPRRLAFRARLKTFR